MKYSIHLILLIGIALQASQVNKVFCNPLDALKDLVTGGDDDKKEHLTPEQEVEKENKESLYQGGIKQQMGHAAVDIVAGRVADYIETQQVPSLMKPAVSMMTSGLKKKLHHKINGWDDQEQIEKLEEEEAHENREADAERREEYGGELEHDEHHRHHDHHHEEGSGEEGEKKEGWFEKIKDKITGDDDEERKDRRKRSAEDSSEQQPTSASKGKLSRLRDFLHLRRPRVQRGPGGLEQ